MDSIVRRKTASVPVLTIAIITLVDSDRIWFKSFHGLDVDEIPHGPGLYTSAILFDEVYIIKYARTDPRTLANPLVLGLLGYNSMPPPS